MRDLDPFGPAGRTRGVDDVGEIGRIRLAIEIRSLSASITARSASRQRTRASTVRQPVAQSLLGDEHRGSSVVERERKPFGGIGRVERYVGATGLEDRQEPHDHVRRPTDEQAHQHLGADAHGSEVASQAIGAGVELGVRERPAASRSGRSLPEPVQPAFRSGDGRGRLRPGDQRLSPGAAARPAGAFAPGSAPTTAHRRVSWSVPYLSAESIDQGVELRLGELIEVQVVEQRFALRRVPGD